MRLKKILLSPIFISITISVLLITGLIILCAPKEQPITKEENVLEIIPFTDFDWTKLHGDEYYKYEDYNYTSMFGIDVAAHQGVIDWKKVKEAGVEFAFIRLGYRGALEGILHTDEQFEANYKNAKQNGIKIGVYWYCQPANEEEAIEEANYVISVLGNRHLDLPIVCDFEETEFADGSLSRLHGFSKDEYTKLAIAFCEKIKKHNEDVMLYSYPYWMERCFNMEELSDYPLWIASYTDSPLCDLPFVAWQYTDKGYVDGINRTVDLDILFIRKNDQN